MVAITSVALLQNTSFAPNGRPLFFTAVTLAFITCIFEGVRRAAVTIAEERDQQTLGLLLLTRLSGAELVQGKYFAIILQLFQAGTAAMPVFAACLLLGGVSYSEIFRAFLALAYSLSLSVAIGFRSSVENDDSWRAIRKTCQILIFSAVILGSCVNTIGFQWVNPMTPVVLISDLMYMRAPWAFWLSIVVWEILVWRILRQSGERFAARFQSEIERETPPTATEEEQQEAKIDGYVPPEVRAAPRWFSEDAMEWFTLRDVRMHDGRWGVFIIAIAAALFLPLLPALGLLLMFVGLVALAVSLCVTAARPFARLRSSGMFEILCTTPLGPNGIVAGHGSALKKLFFWPVVIAAAVIPGAILWNGLYDWSSMLIPLYFCVAILCAGFGIPWIGMAAAFAAKTPHRAVFWTVLFGLLLPRLMVYLDPLYFAVAVPVAKRYVTRRMASA